MIYTTPLEAPVWMIVTGTALVVAVVTIFSWEAYVGRWQARKRAASEAAYARLNPQEKVKVMLSQIYSFISSVDRNGILAVQIWEKDAWVPVLQSQTLMIFARRSDTHEWRVDTHNDVTAVMSMRLKASPIQPILEREFKDVIHDDKQDPVSDGVPQDRG